jgi:hypothetical protein
VKVRKLGCVKVIAYEGAQLVDYVQPLATEVELGKILKAPVEAI